MKSILPFRSYIIFSFIYLLLIILGREAIAWLMKPFLIPFLLLAVYLYEKFSTKKFLLSALFFAWIGDIILMFTDKGELYFIYGLVAFLFSHIAYIILFSKQPGINMYKNKAVFWIGTTAIIIYLLILLSLLLPSLGDLKFPVFVYAILLSTMLLFAFKGYLRWGKTAGISILWGAVFFVCSDSVIAFNKFYTPIPFSTFIIMATYLIAQYLIVTGILKLNRR